MVCLIQFFIYHGYFIIKVLAFLFRFLLLILIAVASGYVLGIHLMFKVLRHLLGKLLIVSCPCCSVCLFVVDHVKSLVCSRLTDRVSIVCAWLQLNVHVVQGNWHCHICAGLLLDVPGLQEHGISLPLGLINFSNIT